MTRGSHGRDRANRIDGDPVRKAAEGGDADSDRCGPARDLRRRQSPVLQGFISEAVEAELNEILDSKFFKGSKRSQAFLKYIVEAACDQSARELKERTLGVAIWGRPADYDTGTDAIVRVKANEVRQRLTQYNLTARADRPVWIALEPGSYLPQITVLDRGVAVAAPIAFADKPGSLHLHAVASIVLVILVASAVGIWVARAYPRRAPTLLARFWEPVLTMSEPIVCWASQESPGKTPAAFGNLNDPQGAFRVRSEIEDLGYRSQIDLAEEISAAELERTPVVLIGGPYTNYWATPMLRGLRFTIKRVDSHSAIVDARYPLHMWADPETAPGKGTEGYVLITRLLRSPFGEGLISIAGNGDIGNQVGSKMVTSTSALRRILFHAPEDWDHKNLQLILRVVVVDGVPSLPQVVAENYW